MDPTAKHTGLPAQSTPCRSAPRCACGQLNGSRVHVDADENEVEVDARRRGPCDVERSPAAAMAPTTAMATTAAGARQGSHDVMIVDPGIYVGGT